MHTRLWLLLASLSASALALHCSPSTGTPIAPPDAAADAEPPDAGPTPDADAPLPDPPLVPTGKVDLLVVMDNSRAMAGKAARIAHDLEVLVDRLANPRCLDAAGNVVGRSNAGACAAGVAEWKPVRDMHVGVISSSLGAMGGDVCSSSNRQNDRARLLSASAGGAPVAGVQPEGFLAYGATPPGSAVPAITDPAVLAARAKEILLGVGEVGCGLEAQLEATYRFLSQPDPWLDVKVDASTNLAQYTGIDEVLLRQRRAFLRPDSLVAVVLATDEDDSSADPLSVRGQGWAFMASQFPGSTTFRTDGRTTTAPRGTSICATSPADPACTSCGFAQTCNAADPACVALKNDPNCAASIHFGPADDSLNVRFHKMKQRFGLDPQYPIARYVAGLAEATVPSRDKEHDAAGVYVGEKNCTNPLFAARLPAPGEELCKLDRGPRNRGLVVFGALVGVPGNLVQSGDLPKRALSSDDWRSILGANPDAYDESGIDAHMIPSVTPRTGLPAPSATRGDRGPDPVHGREWDTQKNDLQLACAFELFDDAGQPAPIQCTTVECDCPPPARGTGINPPLCGPSPDPNVGVQTHGRALPSLRPLRVAKALGQGAVVGSICPVKPRHLRPDDPSTGYRPFFHGLADRMARGLAK